MKLARLRELLIGHALAEERPLGEALRAAGGPGSAAAAVEAEAGRLERALVLAGLPEDEAEVAGAWPAALRPAQERLALLPSRLVASVQLLQTAAYLGLLALFAGWALLVISSTMVPQLQMLGADLSSGGLPSVDWFGPAGAGLIVIGPLLMATAVLGLWFPALHPGSRRHLKRAREAALAAGLRAAGAPDEAWQQVRASFRQLRLEHATAEELDLVCRQATARAEAAWRRLVASVRWIGLTVLCGLGAGATASLYRYIAEMTL